MPGEDFAHYAAKIGGEHEVAAFVELVIVKTGPLPVNASAFHVSAHDEHAIRMAVISTSIPILFCGAAEFAHGYKHDVLHSIAHVLVKRGERLPQIPQKIRELSLHAAFVHVVVPTAAIDEQHFDSDVGFQKLPDL